MPYYFKITLHWTLVFIILFGFNWKLTVEIFERQYTPASSLQIWLLLITIGISVPISFIQDSFIQDIYKTINPYLLTFSILSLTFPIGQRWEFGLFFINFLLKNDFAHLPSQKLIRHDLKKLFYLLAAYAISIILIFIPTLLQNYPEYILTAKGAAISSALYCLLQSIQAVRKDQRTDYSSIAFVLKVVIHIISVTFPLILSIFILEDRTMLNYWTDQILFGTSVALLLRGLVYWLGEEKCVEKPKNVLKV